MTGRTRWIRAFPGLARDLRAATTTEAARNAFVRFIQGCSDRLGFVYGPEMPALEFHVARACTEALRSMILPRNEALAQHSVVQSIWESLRNDEAGSERLSEAFWQDILHLFLGATRRSEMYKGVKPPRFLTLSGAAAGRQRNRELNRLAAGIERIIRRYPSGLDEDIVALRDANRIRILKTLGGRSADWTSTAWQVAHTIRDADTLGALVTLTDVEREAITLAREHHIPFAVTPYYASLMDPESDRVRDHAVRAQVIPPLDYVEDMIRMRDAPATALDFMGETDTSPLPLVTRRYPQVAILKPYNTCAQVCVYCQRNWELCDVMEPVARPPKAQLRRALHWFRRQKTLEEVLITGGDPLMLSDRDLGGILRHFADMPHIRRIRLGTRTPAVLPMRFTPDLLDLLARFHGPDRQIMIVTHFEHPYEITPEAGEAMRRVRAIGISIYNQEVFTIENSRRFETVALRRALKAIGIDPYYTFNTKGKEETRHYRVPIARILQERKEEARLTPGSLRTDEPVFNVPRLGKNYLRAGQDHALIGLLPNGSRVYEFLPWEKNLYPSPTYIHHDVPILDYLRRLEQLGENPDDYRRIWYYF